MKTLTLIIILAVFLGSIQISASDDIPCQRGTSTGYLSKCFHNLGEQAIELKYFEEAFAAFEAGIKAIGEDYNIKKQAIDDTGQKLALAYIEKRNGNLEIASNLLKGVLSSRISLLPVDDENKKSNKALKKRR